MGVKRLAITAAAAFIMASAIAYGLLRWHKAANPVVPPPIVEELPPALVVYCVQDDERGERCEKIEQLALDVLEQSFAKELQDGRVKCLVVNYQHPNNECIVKEYDIAKPTVVVVDGRPGMKRAWKNHQEKVWELLDNDKAFKDYLRDEIDKAFRAAPAPAGEKGK